jgi:cytochrome c peroxidase
MNVLFLFITSISITLFFGCAKDKVEIKPYDEEEFWGFKVPVNFPQPDYKFENNEQTRLRFELGRLLFYDPILSIDNSVSCFTCHDQSHAFSDHNVAFSTGVNGINTHRNAPSLSNLAWYPNFMWDGGVNHIEVQPLVPLTNSSEMGESILSILSKLNASSFYKIKFKEAYNVDEITDQKLLQAIAQFTSMLISANTKYDQYIAGKVDFTTSEKNGLTLFRNNCVACHTEPLFTDFSYRNIGLDTISEDIGRELISQNIDDKGKFKVPSLRNVTLTYPYMHDGRYFTLNQLLNHHTNGALNLNSTDAFILSLSPLNSSEKNDLIQFLKTLEDYQLIGDPTISQITH